MDNMWSYWKQKWGILEAYEQFYSDKCDDGVAKLAFQQAKVALCALDARMQELSGEQDD